MRDMLRMGVILCVICAVMAGALAAVNNITKDRIAFQKQAKLQRALSAVLPSAASFDSATDAASQTVRDAGLDTVREVYVGRSDSGPVGIAVSVECKGYASDISAIVGIDGSGKVAGVTVVSQGETPGLGATVARESFLSRYVGLAADAGRPIRLKKDGGTVEAVTGATISSRALTRGVDQAARLFALAWPALSGASQNPGPGHPEPSGVNVEVSRP